MRMVALLACLAACNSADQAAAPAREPPPVRVKCAPVVESTVATPVQLRGSITVPPLAQAVIASTVPGRLAKLFVEEGDVVTANQLIAVLEDPSLGAAAQQGSAEVAAAHAELRAATSDRARREKLVGEGIAPQKDLDQARAREEAARASVAAATSRSNLARGQLARTDLRAPRSGTVLRVLKTTGAVVDTSDPTVAEIGDLSVLELRSQVVGTDLIGIVRGMRASVLLDALPTMPIDGEVVAVAPAIDPATGLATVRVRLLLPPGWTPAIGLSGVVTVPRAPHAAIIAPAGAVRRSISGTDEVLLCAGDRAEVRSIKSGVRTSDTIEVRAGLAPGDRVIVDHVLGVEDGAAIEATR